MTARRTGVVASLGALGLLACSATLTPLAPSAHAEVRDCTEGQTRFVADSPPALSRLAASRSWTVSTGRGVVVAVVDSGVAATNAHFPRGSVLAGKSFVGGKATTDETGHGTAIAGIIAARDLGEKSGVVGLAKGATILPVKITGGESPGDEEQQRSANLARGISYAVSAGADVINLSLSTTSNRPDVRAAVASAVKAGIVVVASAGNRGQAADVKDGLRYPAANPGVIGVTATDGRDVVTESSIHGPQVDLAAPGDDVITTFRAWGDCVFSQETQSSSYATAYVSAAAALLRQRFPSASPAEIAYRLEATASRGSRTTRDDVSGWGVVQPFEAMTAVLDDTVAGPVAPGAKPRVTPPPEVSMIDLTPARDPRAGDRATVLWLLLGAGASVLGLAMTRMLRRSARA